MSNTRIRQPVQTEDEIIALYPKQTTPRSARQYPGSGTAHTIINVTDHRGQPMQRRASLPYQPYTTAPPTPVPQLPQKGQSRKRKRHWLKDRHPLFYIGSVLTLFLLGWWLINGIISWGHTTWDDVHYGRPRTSQTDLDVGHGGVSHFTAENLGGHIVVYELPNTDVSKAKIYKGPTLVGDGASLMPITLTFRDVNGDGLLDMIIVVDGVEDETFLNAKDGMFHPQGGS